MQKENCRAFLGAGFGITDVESPASTCFSAANERVVAGTILAIGFELTMSRGSIASALTLNCAAATVTAAVDMKRRRLISWDIS